MISRDNGVKATHYPVAIVGGSSIGLMSSIMLSLQGISHVLLERQPDTAIHPKATNLNQRSMELLFKAGVGDEIVKAAAPSERVANTAWYTSLGEQTGTWRGRQIAKRGTSRGKEHADMVSKGSFAPSCIIPQIRLDPILKRRAQELAPGRVHFYHQVVDIEEESDQVRLTVEKRKTGDIFEITADYLIGADGGRLVPGKIGAQWNGETNMAEMLSIHVKAPISTYHPDPSVYISWFVSPELGGSISSGFLYPLGPWTNNIATEEWVFGFALFGDEIGRSLEESEALLRIRKVLKLGETDLDSAKVLSIGRWYLNARVVDKYRSEKGRVFLVGDAAHKVPPWGAFGLNSGFGDVHNLIWKLAAAVKSPGEDWDSLLNTYHEERKPIADYVAKTSLANIRTHSGRIDVALGVRPDAMSEANIREMEIFFDSNEAQGHKKREKVKEAIASLDGEFKAYGCHHGWFYPSVDRKGEGKESLHDGQADEKYELLVTEYHPSTIPGHHLPHAWLVDPRGNRRSTAQMIGADTFVLFAQSQAWAAAGNCSLPIPTSSGNQIEVVLINDSDKMWRDADGTWEKLRGVGATGAVLVRPDGIVASRFKDDTLAQRPDFLPAMEALLRETLYLS